MGVPGAAAIMVTKVSLTEKLALFTEQYSPKIIGEVNDLHVKVSSCMGNSCGITRMDKYLHGDKSALAGGPLYVPTLVLKKDDVAEFQAQLKQLLGQ